MNLKKYFSTTNGTGVMSTADLTGGVNAALYATPHFLEDNTVSFIMRDRLTKYNLDENPYAHYLFMEQSQRSSGVRLSLKKVSETEDKALISELSRRSSHTDEKRFLITFQVLKVIEMLGGKEIKWS